MKRIAALSAWVGILAVVGLLELARGQVQDQKGREPRSPQKQSDPDSPPLAEAEGDLRSLGPNVWLDHKNRRVLLKAQVALREGLLEMLACLKGTKEHESILAVDTQAKLVHTALLLAGAEPGQPVQFTPEYRPASGDEIEIRLQWRDDQGEVHEAHAQEWVRHIKTRQPLQYPWVFAGSRFADGYYLAEGGDLICVANFTTAMLDLPVASSQDNTELLFEAFTDRIPPLGAEVTMYLIPVREEADQPESLDEPAEHRRDN